MIFQCLTPEEIVTRLAAIVDSSEDAIVGRDVYGTINTWNSAAVRLFGYTAEEIIGHSVLLLIPPDLHEQELRNQQRLERGERIDAYETERIRKGGERLEVSIAVSAIRDASGKFIGSALIFREVSALRKEEAARARLAAIVESSEDAIVAKDLNGLVMDWNVSAERMFGYSADEMIGRSIMTIIPPEIQHEEPVILAKLRAGHRVDHYETRRVHKSGELIEVSLTMSPIRDSSGRVIGVSIIAREIRERRKLENARLMLAAIVESSDDAIISKNLDGIITSWNAAAERLFGYKAEEIIGQSVLRIIPRELHFEEPGIISRLRSGERIEHYETRRLRKNGQIVEVSLTVSPIRDSKGNVVGGSKILRDIGDRKAAEALLVEKERLAAAGRLAATLAHEVNNPLESITNLAFLLCEDPSLGPESRRYAELLLKEVQRAGDITRQTLGYYRESKVACDVPLEEVVGHVLKAKNKQLKNKKIEVEVEFADVPSIKGFPGELRQVFDNVIQNAIDAVPFEGHIWLRARVEAQGTESRVVVSVGDDGPGIPNESLPKVLEPFFTTKGETGSGLGLWVSRSIVEKHCGSIQVRSGIDASQRGTVFTITLPVHGAHASRSPALLALAEPSARQ